MSRVLGIDLGTTYSAVACIDEYGKPVVLKNSDGRNTTPSAVFFDAPHYVVGEVALQSTLTDPRHVVQFAKRFMGAKNHRIRVGENEYSPEFVSSLILRKVVQEAEDALGERADSVVIAVPAYFGEAQRHATAKAAQLAGLKVLRLINEPTAAALSYGISNRHSQPRNILVYDLGGGTFDVTILRVSKNNLEVLGVGGDSNLGGKDIDDLMMNFIEERVTEELGCDIEWDEMGEAELRFKAEAAKRQLSGRGNVPVTLKARKKTREFAGTATSSTRSNGFIAPPSDATTPVRIDISRDEFENLCADVLTRTELVLDVVMRRADLDWCDISEVLCVGGSSRMPMVREMLMRVSGKKPLLHDPDECVAKGAAIQAALLAKENLENVESTMRISHVLPHSLGIAAMKNGEAFIDHIVPALTPLPCQTTRHGYTTVIDNQTSVQVRVYEGESEDPESYSSPIGTFALDVLPPRPQGQPDISVEFICDENARITAIARDHDTKKESRALLTFSSQNAEYSDDERFAVQRIDDGYGHEAELLAQAIVS